MTNDQFPSAGESFPGMIDPIIARRARPRDFEPRTSRFPLSSPQIVGRSSTTNPGRILEKCPRISQDFTGFYSINRNQREDLVRIKT